MPIEECPICIDGVLNMDCLLSYCVGLVVMLFVGIVALLMYLQMRKLRSVIDWSKYGIDEI